MDVYVYIQKERAHKKRWIKSWSIAAATNPGLATKHPSEHQSGSKTNRYHAKTQLGWSEHSPRTQQHDARPQIEAVATHGPAMEGTGADEAVTEHRLKVEAPSPAFSV